MKRHANAPPDPIDRCAHGWLAAGVAHAAAQVILPRPGQVGFSLQGQYGTLLSSGNLGDEFGSGPGLAVRHALPHALRARDRRLVREPGFDAA